MTCFISPSDKSLFEEDGTIRSTGKRVMLVAGTMVIALLALATLLLSCTTCVYLSGGFSKFPRVLRARGDAGGRQDALAPVANVALANPVAEYRQALNGAAAEHTSLTRPQIDKLVEKMPTAGCDSASEVCSVCLEGGVEASPLKPRAVLLPSCDHFFHAKCISVWLSRGETSCPVCRRDILGLDEG
jgi:Ring finger domain